MTVESLRTPQLRGTPLSGPCKGPVGARRAFRLRRNPRAAPVAAAGGRRPCGPLPCAPTSPLRPCIPAPSKIYAKEAAAHAAEQMP